MARLPNDSVASVFHTAYGRILACLMCLTAAGTCSAVEPFRVILLPDTQHYTDSAANIVHFNRQTQWIVDNRAAENIVFVSHLGDVVETGSNQVEWQRADAAMDVFDAEAPKLPYGVVLGNHDTDPIYDANGSAAEYVANFGSARYADRSWYGGADNDQRNHYQTFSAGGRQFLNLSLEYYACSAQNSDHADVIAWAQGVLDAHPGAPTIISTHAYLRTNGRERAGVDIFNTLVKDNPQVFLVVNGHAPGENHQTVPNTSGDVVFEVLADYQSRPQGGQSWLRILEFDEDAGLINNITYSPSLDRYETDADSQFSFPVDFNARFGPAEIPEPPSVVLAVLGPVGLAVIGRRKCRLAPG